MRHAVSADGERIVTASDDSTARIWDAQTGRSVGEPLDHGPKVAVYAVDFSRDGTRIITLSSDNTARIWDVAVDLKAPRPFWVAELAEALGGQRFRW